MSAWATQRVTTSASVSSRRAFAAALWQEIIGCAINGGAEGVEVGVHRGLRADGVVRHRRLRPLCLESLLHGHVRGINHLVRRWRLAPIRSARGPFGRGWSPRRPSRRTGRASAAEKRGSLRPARGWAGGPAVAAAASRACARARPRSTSARSVGSCVVKDCGGPFIAPPEWEQGGTRRAETTRDQRGPAGRDPAFKSVIARRRETRREHPRLLLIPRSKVRILHGPSLMIRLRAATIAPPVVAATAIWRRFAATMVLTL